MNHLTFCAASLALMLASLSAQAQSSPWTLRLGPARVLFDTKATVTVAGAEVPGGAVDASANTLLGMELGYAWTDNWTIRLALGVPPTTRLGASGSLTALVPPLTGTLGRVTYGPSVLSATYTLANVSGFKPYIGAGLNYTWVLASKDADVAGLEVKSAFGSALEAGFEYALTPQWSLFADVRKVFVKTTATGTLPAVGGPDAVARVTLNPVIVHAGLGYRF